jgi:hypothetical protein
VERTKEHVRHFVIKMSSDETDFEHSTTVFAYRGTTAPKFMSAPGKLSHPLQTRTACEPTIRINGDSAWI